MQKTTMQRAIWLLCVLVLTGLRASSEEKIDYQKTADGAQWGWLQEMANPLGCISQCDDKYDIRLVSKNNDRISLTITVLFDGREVYSWKGHRSSVFRILDDRLYYANFHPSSTGGRIVAVDLATGKELWASELNALGGIEHSAYLALVNIDCNHDVVTVYGNESMGRYVEFKRTDTGETVGHKIFAKQTSDPVPEDTTSRGAEPVPHPVLLKLKAALEAALNQLDPKPAISFSRGSLNVRFKTRQYTIHSHNKAGRFSADTMQREGPTDDGFMLEASLQPSGSVNQAVVPQTYRDVYWNTFLNVYPAQGYEQQIWFRLKFGGWTDSELLNKIRKAAEQLGPLFSESAPERGSEKGDS